MNIEHIYLCAEFDVDIQHHSSPAGAMMAQIGSTSAVSVVDPQLAEIIASVPQINQWKLDQEIDFEHKTNRGQTVQRHLGKIADSMADWEGAVAECLNLTTADKNAIKGKNPFNQELQR